MSRKANGEGTIIQLKNGKWKAILSVMVNGKRRRPSRTCDRKSDAQAALRSLQAKLLTGPSSFAASNAMTVEKYLRHWLDNTVAKNAPSTIDLYTATVENHIFPALGGVAISKLSPLQIETWIRGLEEDDVGSRTVELAYTTLRNALNHACDRLGLIPSNPVTRIQKPFHKRADIFPFTYEETQRLLALVHGTRNAALLRLAFSCGPRAGELFGLTWDLVDLKRATARIEKQVTESKGVVRRDQPLKTPAAKRVLSLTPATLQSLKEHRAILMREGNAGCDLAFPSPEGAAYSRGNFRIRVWKPLLERAGIEYRGFHHTRHTYATLAIGINTPISAISKNIGHAKISITMDVYGHVLEQHRADATASMSKLFG